MYANPNYHIETYLDYYTNLVAPGFAVLLKGEWGCGKTWFIKNYIEKQTKPSQYLYITLNGVNSIQDVDDDIFYQLHPMLGSKGAKIAGKIAKGLLKTTLKIDLSKEKEATITSGIPDVDLKSLFRNFKNKILVFDDLERCTVPITNILGYINQFVEGNGLNVIIVANEREIEKENATERKYLLIKEKLIGKSFEIKVDFESSTRNFISALQSEEMKEILKKDFAVIRQLFMDAGYKNLRNVRLSILDFERFYSFIPSSAKKKEGLISHILNIFLVISFELQKGAITESDVESIVSYLENRSDILQLREKYSSLFYRQSPIAPKVWADYFRSGDINSTALEESLLNSHYYYNETTPVWRQLWHYLKLDDDVFEKLLSQLWEQFQSQGIKEKEELLHIIGLLLFFQDNGLLIGRSKDEIIDIGKQNIENLIKLNLLKEGKFEGSNLEYGYSMQYTGGRINEFNLFRTYLFEELEKTKNENIHLKSAAQELIDVLKNGTPKEFRSFISYAPGSKALFYDEPILAFIPAETFYNVIIALSNDSKRYVFCEAIRERYVHDYLRKPLLSELPWLKQLKKIFEKEYENYCSKPSGYIIKETIIPIIEKCIQSLDAVTTNVTHD